MREFTTALSDEVRAQRAEESTTDPQQQPIHTKIDGRDVTFHPMTSGQAALAAFAISNGNRTEQVGNVVNIFFGMLRDDDEIMHYKRRLWDFEDPFDPDYMVEMIREALQEWAGKASPAASA